MHESKNAPNDKPENCSKKLHLMILNIKKGKT